MPQRRQNNGLVPAHTHLRDVGRFFVLLTEVAAPTRRRRDQHPPLTFIGHVSGRVRVRIPAHVFFLFAPSFFSSSPATASTYACMPNTIQYFCIYFVFVFCGQVWACLSSLFPLLVDFSPVECMVCFFSHEEETKRDSATHCMGRWWWRWWSWWWVAKQEERRILGFQSYRPNRVTLTATYALLGMRIWGVAAHPVRR